MPSRGLTLAVVVFWLGTTVWLFFREAWPWLQAGEPPRYAFDMSDEIGANVSTWTIFSKGEEIGNAISTIRRRPGRVFELRTEYNFKQDNIAPMKLKKISSIFELTTDGELRGLSFQLKLSLPKPLSGAVGEVKGEVDDGTLELIVKEAKLDEQGPNYAQHLKPVTMPAPKRILNPMHLINRYPGLYDGQSWSEPLFNYLAAVLPVKLTDDSVLAKVSSDSLEWNEQSIKCFKISWYGADHSLMAVTWVRHEDGLVLQQEAHQGGLALVTKRIPNK